MNAPPKIDPVTTDSVGNVVYWLTNPVRGFNDPIELFAYQG